MKNEKNTVMSAREKEVLRTIIPETEKLPFETDAMPMAVGPNARVYVIPEEDKEKVLQEVYPFAGCPGMDETMLDIHENKTFRVREYKVIREDNRNYLVSPYYAKSGGMVIDWIVPGKKSSAAGALILKAIK